MFLQIIFFIFLLQVKGAVTTPRIDKVLTQFRQQFASGAITDPVSQRSLPILPTAADPPDPINEERIRKLEHQVSQLIQKVHY